MDSKEWFVEYAYKGLWAQGFKVKSKLHEEQSKFQKIEVYDTHALGKLLLLDGKTMVSDLDEFVYHETMAHVSFAAHPQAKRALVIGGGDCGIISEFTRHSSLERIDLVEIDERVIAVSKEFFPQCTRGTEDLRVHLHAKDGVQFIKDHKNTYDIVIIDSTDPEDFAAGLFTKKFYGHVYDALTENGLMMAQTENPFLDEYGIKNFYQNLKNVFPNVQALAAPMTIYPGVYWTFAFASKGVKGHELPPEKVEYMQRISQDCKWYNPDWQCGAFALPNLTKKVLGLE